MQRWIPLTLAIVRAAILFTFFLKCKHLTIDYLMNIVQRRIGLLAMPRKFFSYLCSAMWTLWKCFDYKFLLIAETCRYFCHSHYPVFPIILSWKSLFLKLWKDLVTVSMIVIIFLFSKMFTWISNFISCFYNLQIRWSAA